jgi:tyrosinase
MGSQYIELNPRLDRRYFIKGLGAVGTGLIMATLGGCESLFEQIKNRPVRRRLRTGSAEVDNAIAIYKDAVTQMKALPAGNPRSWAAQAGIHGTVAGGFNFCQHGTDHFFSWHRAYLFYLEKICQELTGERSFGLPYWNWNQDPAMHPEFTAGGSPLNHPRINTTVAGDIAFSDATLNTIFADTNFYTFSSQIEGTPHDMTHIIVGADMVTGGSAGDPVFWAHHCMIDYCWAKWNIELENDNTNDPGWLETSWNHFFDGDGDPAEVTAGVTILMPLLSYRYESSPIGGLSMAAAATAGELRAVEERLRRGADVRLDIKKTVRVADRAETSLARPFSKATDVTPGDFAALTESDLASERIFARVKYATLPPSNDFFVRVFINLPSANAATSTDDPHYAGSFAFFGTSAHDHGQHAPKKEFLVYVTDTLQRLRAMNELRDGEPISIQLVAVPIAGQLQNPDASLTLEAVDLIVTPIHVRSVEQEK